MEIRGRLDIASGHTLTNVFSAGQVLLGLASLSGDNERHRTGILGLQEPRGQYGHHEARAQDQRRVRDGQRTHGSCCRLLHQRATGEIA